MKNWFKIISLIVACNINQEASAWLTPEDKTQFILQTYFCNPSKEIKFLMQKRQELERNYIIYSNLLYKIDKDTSLTQEQKDHKKDMIQHKFLKPIAELMKKIPVTHDSFFFINTIEQGVNEKLSIGLKAIMIENKNINKNKLQTIETTIFNKLEIWSDKKKSIIISPQATLKPNEITNIDTKIIYSSSKKWKKFDLIFQSQMGLGSSPHGIKYTLDTTIGLKTQNNWMIMLQKFKTMEPQNPTEIFQDTIKNQISLSKTFQNNITFQAGYFTHSANKPKLLLSTGVISSIWYDF